MRKKIFFYSAIFWTGLILFLCLENANNLKKITIPNFDKVIHFILHFVFTTLWFLYLKKKIDSSRNTKALVMAFLFSFIFGILIEIMQERFTTTRRADIFDVVSNLAGASFAVLLVIVLKASSRIIEKI